MPGSARLSGGLALQDLTGLEIDGLQFSGRGQHIGDQALLTLDHRITLDSGEGGNAAGEIWADRDGLDVVVADDVPLLATGPRHLTTTQAPGDHDRHALHD